MKRESEHNSKCRHLAALWVRLAGAAGLSLCLLAARAAAQELDDKAVRTEMIAGPRSSAPGPALVVALTHPPVFPGFEPFKRLGKPRRPLYNFQNPDGSNKYTVFFGGGFSKPLGDTADSFGTGFRFQGGAGRNFNRKLGLVLQFDWDALGIQNSVLGKLLPVYQTACGTSCTGSPIAEIFGANHVWSFSLNPVYNLPQHGALGIYFTGGAGFYHKVSTFSAPAASSACNGCAQSPTYGAIDHYTSNAAGFHAGLGLTQAIAHAGGQRFYEEVRFVYINNEPRPLSVSSRAQGFNAFPANSQPTKYIPITVGLRW